MQKMVRLCDVCGKSARRAGNTVVVLDLDGTPILVKLHRRTSEGPSGRRDVEEADICPKCGQKALDQLRDYLNEEKPWED